MKSVEFFTKEVGDIAEVLTTILEMKSYNTYHSG